MINELNLIGRTNKLFSEDISKYESQIKALISSSSFLVIGGAGSIGQAVVKEIFKRGPKVLHVVDISENNLVELVRDLRSSFGYIDGKFETFPLDCGSLEFDVFIQREEEQYDYILNLSALKHVRSEKDAYSLMRLINVNIFNTDKTIRQAIEVGASKYFCVSTDKAANPVNMMGASKRIMELFLMKRSMEISISTARFANVAFSDGSLLHGFRQRILKNQPIAAPRDVKRYFVTFQEAGELCLLSCLLGENRDVFFPKLLEELHLVKFSDIAIKYLSSIGYEAQECESEDIARKSVGALKEKGKWPCFFFDSDTTGEKDFEEFFTESELLDINRFDDIGVIKNNVEDVHEKIDYFTENIDSLKKRRDWSKQELVKLFNETLPEFQHQEKGKNLENKM
jgi:UDP-N-acetylglucosamine 4,6-dehydratase